MNRLWIYLVPILGVLAVAGGLYLALSDTGHPRRRESDALLLLCDESLRYPIEAPEMEHESGVAGRFLRRTGVHVRAEYGPPRDLLNELMLGRDGYLFLAAGDDYLETAKEAGLIHETRRVARLIPVILVRSGNPHGIADVADLADSDLRLAVADDRTSLMGAVTGEVFRKNEISMQDLENITYVGSGTADVASAVVNGRADAAVLWRSAAAGYRRATEKVDIAPKRNVYSWLVAAVLETSREKEKALRFADFLSGPAAGQVFEIYGFDAGDATSNQQ